MTRFLLFTLLLLSLMPNEQLNAAGAAPKASIAPHAPPPPAPENPPQAPAAAAAPDVFSAASLRRFVLAFLQATSAAEVEEQLAFFADEVDYRGQRHASRREIRRDLEQLRKRWPERHFTLAGELQMERQADGRVRLSFPLHYELRSGTGQKAGGSRESLVLARTVTNGLEIVGLSGGPRL